MGMVLSVVDMVGSTDPLGDPFGWFTLLQPGSIGFDPPGRKGIVSGGTSV